MSDKASTFKLGLFTIFAVALLLGFVTLLGSGLFERPSARAETYMRESVQGLDVGAPVKFRGVRVGRVSWIGFVAQKYDTQPGPDNLLASYVLVQMEFHIQKSRDAGEIEASLPTLIKAGLHARIAPSSLVGPAYLELLIVEPPNVPDTIELTWRPQSFYIPSTPSVLSQITNAIEQLAQKLNKVDFEKLATGLDNLLGNTNTAIAELKVVELREKIGAFFDDAKASSARIREIVDSPEVQRILSNVDGVAASLNSGDPAQKDLAAFVQDLPRISAKLKNASDRLDAMLSDPKTDRMLTDLQTTLRSTPQATEDLRLLLARINAVVAENQEDVARIVRTLRKVLDSSANITEDAQANPSRLLFGDPPPRERPGDSGAGDRK